MWAYLIHNIGLGLSAAVTISYIYMSIKLAKPSLSGIFKGAVREEYTKEHHGRWYDKLKEEEKKQKLG